MNQAQTPTDLIGSWENGSCSSQHPRRYLHSLKASGPRVPGLSLVVPVFNEAPCLHRLVEEVSQALSNLQWDWELILVDDGSDDNSRLRLLELCSNKVRAISLERNSGQSAALMVGFRAARFDIVATMDGDGQNNPADLFLLLEGLQSADMVCGIRQHRQDNTWRRLVSRVANSLRSKLTGDGIKDTGCSLKVMTAAVIDNMPFFQGAHRFMPALAKLEGYRVSEVLVSHRARAAGQTKYRSLQRLKATIPDLFGFLWLKSRHIEYSAREIRL